MKLFTYEIDMASGCENLAYIDPENHDIRCREMQVSHEPEILLQALKEEFMDKYYTDLCEYMDMYIGSLGDEQDELLAKIESIASHYPDHPAFIERMGYFAWNRFFQEENPIFLLNVAHRVHELSWHKHEKINGSIWLEEEFYTFIFEEISKPKSLIEDILARILQILGNEFGEWLEREVNTKNLVKWPKVEEVLGHYAQYKNRKY